MTVTTSLYATQALSGAFNSMLTLQHHLDHDRLSQNLLAANLETMQRYLEQVPAGILTPQLQGWLDKGFPQEASDAEAIIGELKSIFHRDDWSSDVKEYRDLVAQTDALRSQVQIFRDLPRVDYQYGYRRGQETSLNPDHPDANMNAFRISEERLLLYALDPATPIDKVHFVLVPAVKGSGFTSRIMSYMIGHELIQKLCGGYTYIRLSHYKDLEPEELPPIDLDLGPIIIDEVFSIQRKKAEEILRSLFEGVDIRNRKIVLVGGGHHITTHQEKGLKHFARVITGGNGDLGKKTLVLPVQLKKATIVQRRDVLTDKAVLEPDIRGQFAYFASHFLSDYPSLLRTFAMSDTITALGSALIAFAVRLEHRQKSRDIFRSTNFFPMGGTFAQPTTNDMKTLQSRVVTLARRFPKALP